MRKLDIIINNKQYHIHCDEEQVDYIQQLSDEIDTRARLVANNATHSNETNILMMTCLHLADELYETRQEAGRLHEKILYDTHDLHAMLPASSPRNTSSVTQDNTLHTMLDELTDSLGDLTQKLEKL